VMEREKVREVIGSPGWARTSDFLINRPFGRVFGNLSPSQPVTPRRTYLSIDPRSSNGPSGCDPDSSRVAHSFGAEQQRRKGCRYKAIIHICRLARWTNIT